MPSPPLEAHYSFEGIGGFGLGFGAAGFISTGMNEINQFRQEVLHRAWPDTRLEGDIKNVRGSEIGRPTVMAAGFPCEGLTIAQGHRKGLNDHRSHEFYSWLRLLDEHLALVEYANPRWVVLENAPGILELPLAMAAVTKGVEELGYGWAYRVVNGAVLRDPLRRSTPQQRRRWFLVGHLGGDPRPSWAVLGDDGAGEEVAAPRPHRRSEPGPGPSPLAQRAGGLVRIWRKSVNPRMSIEKGYEGGYRETWVNDGKANVLTKYDTGLATRQKHLLAQGGRLRTLTLTEWERLCGFPDGWTAGISDSQRYAALGDSCHTGTAMWLADRLRGVHESLVAHPALFDAA